MNSDQILFLAPAFAGGAFTGALNFMGLWLTVKQVRTAVHPTRLILISLAARTGATMAAFYLIMGGQWERLLACTAGYFLVRLLSIIRIRISRPAMMSG